MFGANCKNANSKHLNVSSNTSRESSSKRWLMTQTANNYYSKLDERSPRALLTLVKLTFHMFKSWKREREISQSSAKNSIPAVEFAEMQNANHVKSQRWLQQVSSALDSSTSKFHRIVKSCEILNFSYSDSIAASSRTFLMFCFDFFLAIICLHIELRMSNFDDANLQLRSRSENFHVDLNSIASSVVESETAENIGWHCHCCCSSHSMLSRRSIETICEC